MMTINNMTSKWSIGYASAIVTILTGCVMTAATTALAEPADKPNAKAEFLKLCDMACEDLNKEITIFDDGRHRTTVCPRTHHMPFVEESYGVRALCQRAARAQWACTSGQPRVELRSRFALERRPTAAFVGRDVGGRDVGDDVLRGTIVSGLAISQFKTIAETCEASQHPPMALLHEDT
jgi:hypothetical protein